MILRKDSWSHEEDLAIMETFMAYAKEGKKQYEAIEYLTQVLYPRTANAIRQRWSGELRKKVLPQMKEIINPEPEQPKVELSISDIEKLMNLPHLEQETLVLLNLKIRDIIERSI